jgi:hypothetical protein
MVTLNPQITIIFYTENGSIYGKPKGKQYPARRCSMEASERGFPHVYVLMPFGDEYNQIYDNLILPALDMCEVDRAGDLTVHHNVLGYIIQSVVDSDLVVADLTGLYPFVLYELGIAHALAKPTILLTQNVEELPFDLRPRAIVYSTYFADADHLRQTLRTAVSSLVEGTHIEYNNPVMDFVPALFNGMATYPQTATLERLLNVVSARLEMARMAEAETVEAAVEEVEVVEAVVEEALVEEEPVAELTEEPYDEVAETPEAVEADLVEEALVEEEPVAELTEEPYDEVEEAPEAVEADLVEEAADDMPVAEATEEPYGEVEEAPETVEADLAEEATDDMPVAEATTESEEVPEKLLFTPFMPAEDAEEEPVAEAAEAVESEVSPKSGNGYGEPAEAGAEAVDEEAAAETYQDPEAEAAPIDDEASSEDVEVEAGEDEPVIELGAGETGMEAEDAGSSEEASTDEPEQIEGDKQDTSPWAY